jgi:hypothetical protein
MAEKVTGGLIEDILLDMIREILYFPVWWYTRGLAMAAAFSWRQIKNMEIRLGVKVWVVNIFTPMFGQRDVAGVIISFFMRIFQIIVRTIALLFWFAFMVFVFFLWIALPLVVLFGIIFNLAAIK